MATAYHSARTKHETSGAFEIAVGSKRVAQHDEEVVIQTVYGPKVWSLKRFPSLRVHFLASIVLLKFIRGSNLPSPAA